MPLALLHGAAAAAGLVTLLLAVLGGLGGTATISLVLFVGAALGGFVLFAQHLKSRRISKGLVIVHGLVAVVAFVLLLLATQSV